MQYTNEKSLLINKALAETVKELRIAKKGLSANKFGEKYGIEKNNILRIERADGYCKLITLWQIANALGMSCSELIKCVENKIGKDFSLTEK